jgi:structure-specific endonuclease subunit SLX1
VTHNIHVRLQVQALQFEWAWQHPTKSKVMRPVAQRLGSRALYGLKGKVRLLLEMLQQPPWRYYPLTLQFLQPEYHKLQAGEG